MVSQPRLHHKNARGLNKNPMMICHHILQNRRERINVEDVVGLIGRRITLILFKPLPPTLNHSQICFNCKVYGHDANHCFTLHLELWQGWSQAGNARKSQGSNKGYKGKGVANNQTNSKPTQHNGSMVCMVGGFGGMASSMVAQVKSNVPMSKMPSPSPQSYVDPRPKPPSQAIKH